MEIICRTMSKINVLPIRDVTFRIFVIDLTPQCHWGVAQSGGMTLAEYEAIAKTT
jgi:hypothetical protein